LRNLSRQKRYRRNGPKHYRPVFEVLCLTIIITAKVIAKTTARTWEILKPCPAYTVQEHIEGKQFATHSVSFSVPNQEKENTKTSDELALQDQYCCHPKSLNNFQLPRCAFPREDWYLSRRLPG